MSIEVTHDEQSVTITLVSDHRHSVVMDHPRAHLLLGRLKDRSPVTLHTHEGSLEYRNPLLGADTLAISTSFLAKPLVRIELDDTKRARLIKALARY